MPPQIDKLIVPIEEECQFSATVGCASRWNTSMNKYCQALERDILSLGEHLHFPGSEFMAEQARQVPRLDLCLHKATACVAVTDKEVEIEETNNGERQQEARFGRYAHS